MVTVSLPTPPLSPSAKVAVAVTVLVPSPITVGEDSASATFEGPCTTVAVADRVPVLNVTVRFDRVLPAVIVVV